MKILYHVSYSHLLMSSRIKHYWSFLFFVNGDRHIPPPKNACGLKDWGYYCKRLSSILRSIVLTIQKVCWLDFLQVPRGRCGKNTITSSTTIVKLSKRTFACFNDKQSTQYHKKHFDLINETFSTQRLCEWRHRENRWQTLSAFVFFGVKWILNRIWNWLMKVFRCKLVFTQMVFDSWLHFVWPVEYSIITERESKNTFELFCKEPLSCRRAIRVRKLLQ